MKMDRSKLRALADMDDQTFAQLLFTAARTVGLSPTDARAAAANAHAFKAVLRNADETDLAQIENKLKGNPADLLKQLGGREQ